METTIIISGKEVRLKSTAATPMRYKAQFRKDYFSELMKLGKIFNGKIDAENSEINFENITYEELSLFDFEVFYNFIWVLAKTADPTIPEPLTWLDEFDEMPMEAILPEITDLLQSSIKSKKK